MDDELSQRGVEGVGLEREVLRRRGADVDAGIPLSRSDDESLRRIDGRHPVHTDPADELDGQRAGTAADVEHALAGRDAREIGERHRKRPGVPPHEPVVRVGSDGEAHRPDPTPVARRATMGNATRVVAKIACLNRPAAGSAASESTGTGRPPRNDTEM